MFHGPRCLGLYDTTGRLEEVKDKAETKTGQCYLLLTPFVYVGFRTSTQPTVLELTQAKADGSYSKALQTLAKLDLLTIDDWGLEALKAAQRNDLMEIMDDRHNSSSTLMLSQLPTDQWYPSIGDNTLADAILDRLMHIASS